MDEPTHVAGIEKPQHGIPLTFNEGRLLEVLFTTLQKYVNIADAQMILDDLRDELYSGIEIGNLKNLHTIALNCRKCPAAIPEVEMPRWNLVNPDMVLVAEGPIGSKDISDILIKGLSDAGFTHDRVALTFVNRCRLKEKRRYNDEEIRNCLRFLHTELQILKPKLIVPLGLVPTAALLGTDVKLGDFRGQISWLGPWAIYPTYSPAHVLKGPPHLINDFTDDMKAAHRICYGER